VHELAGIGYDSNIFLIGGEEPALVDAGSGENTSRTAAWIRGALGPRRLSRIILTHRHYDHTGGAASIAAMFGAEVMAHPIDAQPVRQGSSHGTSALMFDGRQQAVEVTDLVEGAKISTGDHDLVVVHTPGHTAGGISLWDARDRRLFSGDTVFADNVGRWDLPTGSRPDLVRSVRKLQALGAVDLLPGHGPSVHGDAGSSMELALRLLGE